MLGSRWTQKPPVGTPIDPSHPLAAGLAALFPFNEGTGVPLDVAARSAAASNSAAWASGPYGRDLAFNGTSGAVLLGSSATRLNFTGPFTIAAFCAPTVNNTGFLLDGRNSAFANGYDLAGAGSSGSNALQLQVYGSGSYVSINSSANAIDGNWHTFGVSLASGSSGGVAFYRDGAPWGTGTSGGFAPLSSGPWAIGSRNDGGARWLSGPMGWIGCWNRALSAAEHALLAANPWQLFLSPRVSAWGPVAATISPAPAPTGTPTGTPIINQIGFQFSEAIVATNLAFAVTNLSTNASVAGTVAYDSNTHLATFTPSAPFARGTKYQVTVSGATAADGTPMAPDTFIFDPGTGGRLRYLPGRGRRLGRLTA